VVAVGRREEVAAVVQETTKLICTDTDGIRILDYLDEVVAKNSVPGHAEQQIQPAYDFVLAEQERFISKGTTKMIERYAVFRSYFESRPPLRGLHSLGH
jgi:hypothetical protein